MHVFFRRLHSMSLNRYLFFYALSLLSFFYAESKSLDSVSDELDEVQSFSRCIIKDIVIEGNKYITKDAILQRLPYAVGQIFEADKTQQAIRNIYDLGSFSQVQIDAELLGDQAMRIYIVVSEKKLLETIEFKGNKALRTKQLKEKLAIEKIVNIDDETVHHIVKAIQKLYREESRHYVNISSELILNKSNNDKATVIFTIDEGRESKVKYVHFVGNQYIPDRKLRTIIFTRENWLLSFTDSAGNYNPDMLDMDKHRIEYFYRDHGYLMAKVAKPSVAFSDNKKDISVTFSIKEGKQFFVRDLNVIGDEIFEERELLPLIALETGKPYSQSSLVKSINKIKDIYGEKGYIYCDVYPQIKPDENSDEVDVIFHIEHGNKLYANRIVITGNKVTRDKVVRRQLEIVEGDLITTRKLNKSETAVEFLNFFERDSVKWRLHRISDDLADLELSLKETKTGNFNFNLSYGTDQYNPKPSLRGTLNLEKANLFGKGRDIGGRIQADRHRWFRLIELHYVDPHIFDSNVLAEFFFYKRWDEYDQWTSLDRTPKQRLLGGDVRLGFLLPHIDKHLRLIFDIGIEDIRNNNPKPRAGDSDARLAGFDILVKRTFQKGTLQWFRLDLVKDTRDHPVYPRSGHKVCVGSHFALPGLNKQFSFLKFEGEGSFYTSLIDKFILDDSLIFCLHAKFGTVTSLSRFKPVPYKELYHMGGQSTVRGFVWGGIGPAWVSGDPLGARNAIQWNAELIFPLIPDYSMKAHLFYDAGAGWDTPKHDMPDRGLIKRDKFDLRHSVGFGLNLLKPMPAKIDWGFKLDRKKKDHESSHEFHLSMNYAW